MKRSFVAVSIAVVCVLLSGCSMFGSKEKEVAVEQTNQIQQFGSVQVRFDKKGVWTEITSTASAGVHSDEPRVADAAMKLASTDAKRNIATFLGSTVGYNTITKTGRNGDDVRIQSTDTVTERASALLKGMVVDQQYVEGDRAYARVAIRRNELGAAKQIRIDMMK